MAFCHSFFYNGCEIEERNMIVQIDKKLSAEKISEIEKDIADAFFDYEYS